MLQIWVGPQVFIYIMGKEGDREGEREARMERKNGTCPTSSFHTPWNFYECRIEHLGQLT